MSSRENASTEGGADRTLRRVRFAAGVKARTGINDAMIQDLVHAFDERVRADPMLGSKFEARNSDRALPPRTVAIGAPAKIYPQSHDIAMDWNLAGDGSPRAHSFRKGTT